MTDFAQRGPLGQKAPKPANPPRKGVKPVSDKRKAFKASAEGKAGAEYLSAVHQLMCICGCGKVCEEAHHCKDRPPADDNEGMGPYERLACAGRKSSDIDTIPLCQESHRMFHLERARFNALYGPDYSYIPQTREYVKQRLDHRP